MLHRLLHCGDGTWQREYAQLHSGILAGRAAPRYLLAHGQNGGQRTDLYLLSTGSTVLASLLGALCPNTRVALGQSSPHVSLPMLARWQQSRDRTHQQQWPQPGRRKRRVCGGAAGLADSLVGAVTLFWVAVLQRRAFAMKFGAEGAYEWAFDQPHINWTW